MPEWIAVRTPQSGRISTFRAPFDAATTDVLVRAARRVVPDRTRISAKPHHSVYVVLLQFSTDDYGIYVGSTGLSPDERFLNHKAGRKASRWVRRSGVGLLPALYRHLNPLDWESATRAEVALAQALSSTGVRVQQG